MFLLFTVQGLYYALVVEFHHFWFYENCNYVKLFFLPTGYRIRNLTGM